MATDDQTNNASPNIISIDEFKLRFSINFKFFADNFESLNSKATYREWCNLYTDWLGSNPIDLSKISATELIKNAIEKYKVEDYQGAINDLTDAIVLEPDHPEAYVGRGRSKVRLEDFQSAIVDFTKAIDLEPKHPGAYIGRGLARNGLGNYQAAIRDFTEGIELDPENTTAFYHRGMAYLELNQKKNARTDLLRAKELGYNIPDDLLEACK